MLSSASLLCFVVSLLLHTLITGGHFSSPCGEENREIFTVRNILLLLSVRLIYSFVFLCYFTVGV